MDQINLMLQSLFIFCVCFALISDARTMRIPNWIAVVLVGTFLLYATIHSESVFLIQHGFAALIAFSIGFVFHTLKWFGGGDVKFLAAVTLWMGPNYSFQFVLLLSLLGMIFALSLLIIRKFSWLLNEHWFRYPALKRIKQWADRGICPYGIPISLSALFFAPLIF